MVLHFSWWYWGFELLLLLGRCSITWAIPLFFVLVIFQIRSHGFFCLGLALDQDSTTCASQ
jgi:hypothetical protein